MKRTQTWNATPETAPGKVPAAGTRAEFPPAPSPESASDGEEAAAIGWLRFVRTWDGQGIHAGLLETSVHSEPLGFRFVRGNLQGSGDECEVPLLAEALLRSCASPPALLLGLAEEITSRQLRAFSTEAPVGCVVRTSGGRRAGESWAGAAQRVLWAHGPPRPQSAARGIFDRIMQWTDPFEPAERVARALAVAFADSRVRSLMEIRGLKTVISLLPRASKTAPQMSDDDVSLNLDAAPEGEEQDPPEIDLDARLWALLAAPRTRRLSDPPDPRLEWPAELMPFQREGVQALIKMGRLLLSDDMGLGKTVQTVAALRILKAQGELDSALVVAPASVLDQWRRELARWAPELGAIIVRGRADDRSWQWQAGKDITLASYDVLRQDAEYLAGLRAAGNAWDVVVLDEAQKIKNRNETSEAAKNLPRLRSWALTGTPIENDESELASIMEFVDHDQEEPRKRYSPGAALRHRHRALQLRRKKNEVLQDLPPKLETRLTVPLHRDQRESYDRAEHEGIVYLRSLGAEVDIRHVLELITRLKQICNADPKTGASSKLDDIGGRLQTLADQGHKALIFSQYTKGASGVAAAANHLRAFNPLVLTGETPVDRRTELIDRFRTGDAHKALIVSLRAGGLGLNLQEASYVFHLDRWWNPAVERQAEDRSHRLGQTVKVNVIKYTCEDTIEERIDRILRRKQELFDQLIDDVSMELSSRMSRKELLNLFGLG